MAVPPAEPEPVGPGHYRTDVVIVGAGLAGLYAATALGSHLGVIVVDKGTPGGRSGSSSWAQGGVAVAVGPGDSPQLHLADTVRTGDGLVDHTAAWTLAIEAPAHAARLVALGARFDARPGHAGDDLADLALAREGGHTFGRSLHAADATGAELIRTVRAAVTARTRRLQGRGVALARTADGPCRGVWVQTRDGLVLVEADAVLLATGGCGALFEATTNPEGSTGDGVALASFAGAATRDMEFIQFHPTGLAVEGPWRFLLTEALRGAGATLHDDDGHRFMPSLHPDAELAPRHVVAGAILDRPGGRAWLDARMLGGETLEREFPTVVRGARTHGFDLATELVPVTPAAHYMMGGVRTDLDGHTSLPGLYAAGEVACTGLHGANRMAGNSLAEALVFGARSAAAIVRDLPAVVPGPVDPAPEIDHAPLGSPTATVRARLRTVLSHGAGPIRTAEGLGLLGEQLQSLATELGIPPEGPATPHDDPEVSELRLAVHVAGLVRTGALARPESRGGHVRADHPGHAEGWERIHLEQSGRAVTG